MNCQPIKDILRYPQDRLLCPTHVDIENKQVFEKNLFKCVTRPALSGVLLKQCKVSKNTEKSCRSQVWLQPLTLEIRV